MYIVDRMVSRGNHYIGVISMDEYPENPLTSWDMFQSGMVYDRASRYVCGTEAACRDDFELPRGAIALQVYANNQSGECFAGFEPVTSWPDGADALVYVTREKIQKEYNCKYITKGVKARVIEALRAEVEVYSAYRSGEVYNYMVYAVPADFDPDTDLERLQDWQLHDWDIDDSCGGYYELKSAQDALRESLEYADEARERELAVEAAEQRAIDAALAVEADAM